MVIVLYVEQVATVKRPASVAEHLLARLCYQHLSLVIANFLQDGYVTNIADVVKVGDTVKARVLSVDVNSRRLALSRKGLAGGRPAGRGGPRQVEDAEEGEWHIQTTGIM